MKFFRTMFQNVPDLADAAFKRFRLPVIVAIIASAIGIFLVYHERSDSGMVWILKNMLLALYLSVPALATAHLLAERFALKTIPACALKLGTLGLFILYYALMPPHFTTTDIVRYLLYCIASVGSLFFIPLSLGYGTDAARRFILGLLGRAAWGYLVAMILFAGLSFAVTAIQALFLPDWHDSWKVISSLFIASTGIVFPWVTLAYIPSIDKLDTMPVNEKVAGAIGKFVLIPVVSFYLIILYLYFTKVLILSELPKGWVSYLVLSFSAAGILTYIAVLEEARLGSGIAPRFTKWLWRALLPLLFLLWYAIAQRTGAYGITERRYILIVLAALLSAWVIYFIFTKAKNILVIPTTLAVAAVAISFGPWGAFEVSFRSQRGELMELLTTYSLLADGKITALKGEMPFADRKKLSSVLMYLETHGWLGRLSDLIPPDITLKPAADRDLLIYPHYSDASDTKKILDKIGVRYVYDYEQEDQGDYFSVNIGRASGVLPIEGFVGVVHLACPGPWKEGKQEPALVTTADGLVFELADECTRLRVSKKETMLFDQMIGTIIQPLFDKRRTENHLYDVPLAEVTFDTGSDPLKLKVILTSLYGRREKESLKVTQTTMQVYYGLK